MSSLKSRCSLHYHSFGSHELESFALGVKLGYFGHNPPFTVLTITEVAFLLIITNFVTARGNYENGGEAQKGDFLLARTALIEALDFLAKETDLVADGNTEIITLAGFHATKTGQSAGVKPGQAVAIVKRGITGEFLTGCEVVEHAKHYGCLVTEGAPKPDWIVISGNGQAVVEFNHPEPPVPGPELTAFIVDLNDQREKKFQNLKPGVTYYFYYYAINAAGVGPMSDGVSMMCA